MSFETINANRYDVDSPVSTDLFGSIVDDLIYLNGVNISGVDAGGAPLVFNGSFESPLVASSTTPYSWTLVPGTGGSIVTINTDQIHGSQCLKITRDNTIGHTGGTATSSSTFTVSSYLTYLFIFMIKSSRADVSNTVVINWFTSDGSPLSSTTIYSSTSAPTSWIDVRTLVTPPLTAAFGKIILSGGTATTTPAATASTFFDGLSMSLKPPFSGVASFTSNTSLTIVGGSGSYCPGVWKFKLWGKYLPGGSGSLAGGGYLERTLLMDVGDTAVFTFTGNSNISCLITKPSGTITLVVGATTINGSVSGVATGGDINMVGASRATAAIALLEF